MPLSKLPLRPLGLWPTSARATATAAPALQSHDLPRRQPRQPQRTWTGLSGAAALAAGLLLLGRCNLLLAGHNHTGMRRFASSASVRRAGKVAMGSHAISLLGASEAIALDEDLITVPGFSVDQLMELAGLSVASAVYAAYPPPHQRRVLLVCGPGNNGGDGLVAARHLWHFGYLPTVVYPKRTSKQLYTNLVVECEQLGIPVLSEMMPLENLTRDFDVVVDAIFGFSFKGTPRAPFDSILATLNLASSTVKLVSVDIPSGWDVELGDVTGNGLKPNVLVSLTAPKLCAANYRGRHFLGGRFVPPGIVAKYNLSIPQYPGADQVVELQGWG